MFSSSTYSLTEREKTNPQHSGTPGVFFKVQQISERMPRSLTEIVWTVHKEAKFHKRGYPKGSLQKTL